MSYPTKFTIRLPEELAMLMCHAAWASGKSPTAVATEWLSQTIPKRSGLPSSDEQPTTDQVLREVLARQFVLLDIALIPYQEKGADKATTTAENAKFEADLIASARADVDKLLHKLRRQ